MTHNWVYYMDDPTEEIRCGFCGWIGPEYECDWSMDFNPDDEDFLSCPNCKGRLFNELDEVRL